MQKIVLLLSLLLLAIAMGASGTVAQDELPVGGVWEDGARMRIPRFEAASAVMDGQIYIAGGWSGTYDILDSMEVYDIESNTWSEAAPMPRGLHHFEMAAIDGLLYVSGGAYGAAREVNDLIYSYDPETDTWSEVTQAPDTRIAHAMVAVDESLVMIGGGPSYTLYTGEVWSYNVVTDEWDTSHPDLPTQRDHVAAVVLDGLLYVIGGRSNSGLINYATVEVYDPVERAWSEVAPLPEERSSVTAAVINGQIHVTGGEDISGDTARAFGDHYVYDPQTDTWTTLRRAPRRVHGVSSVGYDGRWYILSGSTAPGDAAGVIRVIMIFTPDDE